MKKNKYITVKEFKAALESVGAIYEEWLREAKALEKRRAFQRTSLYCMSASEAVERGIYWMDTYRGHDYWQRVYNNLLIIERRNEKASKGR